jgi:hypothetical protein
MKRAVRNGYELGFPALRAEPAKQPELPSTIPFTSVKQGFTPVAPAFAWRTHGGH